MVHTTLTYAYIVDINFYLLTYNYTPSNNYQCISSTMLNAKHNFCY